MTLNMLFIYLKSDLQRLCTTDDDSKKSNYLFKLFSPRFTPVLLVRIARYSYLNPVLKPLSIIFTWLNVLVFGIEFTPKCIVGKGLMIPHTVGTVIGANKIGDNVTIFQGVTIGASHLDMSFNPSLRPTLGNSVTIGSGAKILGNILIGDNVIVGANAVVVKSLPDGCIATGIPAKPNHEIEYKND
jgi:serine O-acetyltransferase